MTLTRLCLIGLLAIGFVAVSTPASAQAPPPLINYQGRLVDAENNLPITGPRDFEFRVYDAPINGTVIWGPQSFSEVPIVDGYYNVILSNADGGESVTTAFAGDGDESRFFSVTIDGEEQPRQQILSVPFATNISNASVSEVKLADDSVTSAKIVNETIVGEDIAEGAIGKRELAPVTVYTAELNPQQTQPFDLNDGYAVFPAEHSIPGLSITMELSGDGSPVMLGFRRKANASNSLIDQTGQNLTYDITISSGEEYQWVGVLGFRILIGEDETTYTTRLSAQNVLTTFPLSALNYMVNVPVGTTEIEIIAIFSYSGDATTFSIDPETEIYAYEM